MCCTVVAENSYRGKVCDFPIFIEQGQTPIVKYNPKCEVMLLLNMELLLRELSQHYAFD